MRSGSFRSLDPAGFHRVAYTEYGDRGAERTVICVHGLTRNSSDFKTLAEDLAQHHRVVCVDVPGRGASDWLRRPEDYGYPVYCADLAALIAHLGADEVDWIGTSMGGLIGMLLAARPGTPVRRLVLNDIGPFIPVAAVERIAGYAGTDPRFDSVEALDAYLAEVHAPFGPFTEAEWRAFVASSVRALPDGRIALAYDPAIATPMRAMPLADVDMWPVWDQIESPVLVVRGVESDVLTAGDAQRMTRTGPGARLLRVEGVGHAPTLNGGAQIDAIRAFLAGG